METRYVLYDKANDTVVSDEKGIYIIYNNREDAENNCYGNEYVTSLLELPINHLLNTINHGN